MTTTNPGTLEAGDTASPRSGDGFASAYSPLVGVPDELLSEDGLLRPHWLPIVEKLDQLGEAELNRRWEQARRLIHDNGVTHNVYGDPEGLSRPWSLDLVPLPLPTRYWASLCAGLEQRARLLDSILADLHGPARSVTEGILPPELVFGNPHFLRPCHGITPPGGRWLHFYGADLVRVSDGGFEVLGDRTQAPSGAGYALENRLVVSRVLPSFFRQLSIRRLAPFFDALRTALAALAPSHRENPRVVLLTPGPYNETYFEHAYLARFLGYSLVQGNDLTVREGKVFLKTLGGLQRVDVIFRRVDDNYCDPVELFSGSYLGIPGLLEAVREGAVAVANALGSGLLHGPSFFPYLPQLSRTLLSEDLLLPSVPTWWCGDEAALRYVLEHFEELAIKPAFSSQRDEPIFVSELGREERERLAARVRARPRDFVAQTPAMQCTTPALVGERVEPRRFVLRAFATASSSGFTVLQGGLARTTRTADSRLVSIQKSGGSKDVWILGEEEPVSEATPGPASHQPIELSRGGEDLPSRIADDLYWLGRYVERAGSTVRTARSILTRLASQGALGGADVIKSLLRALLGSATPTPVDQLERSLVRELLGPSGATGLRGVTESVHRLARGLRDRLSLDSWRILQGLEEELGLLVVRADNPAEAMLELCDRLVIGYAAFLGLSNDSMTRGQAWRFLDIGVRIERGLSIVGLLRTSLLAGTADDPPLLEALLEIADSAPAYRRRYLTTLETHAVVDLLLADETNPRAVAFQARKLEEHLETLPREAIHPRRSPDLQVSVELRSRLRLCDIEGACVPADGRRILLEELLESVEEQFSLLSESIGQLYFTHAAAQRTWIASSEGPQP